MKRLDTEVVLLDSEVDMLEVNTFSLSRKAMFWGGSSLGLVGGLSFLSAVSSWLPNMYGLQLMLRSAPSQSVQIVALLVGSIILAFGFRREVGIVGSSLIGRVALLLYGLAFPLQILSSFMLSLNSLSGTALGLAIGTIFEVCPVVAVFVAGIVVVRARTLKGFARWGLVVFASLQTIVFILAIASTSFQSYYPEGLFYVTAFPSLALTLWGASLVFYGKLPSIKRHIRTVYDKWRLTT